MKISELKTGEEIILQENIIDGFKKRVLALTNKRILFLNKEEVEREIEINKIVEAYPNTNVWTDYCELKLRLQNEKIITINWYGKSFLARIGDFKAGDYTQTYTQRWVNKITELKNEHLKTKTENPQHILDVRFAKGEISKSEYEEMKQFLQGENNQ